MHSASGYNRRNRSTSPGSIRSHLLKTSIVATLAAPTSSSTALTASMWRSRSGLATSMTCNTRSASATCSSVARKAATSVCGSRSMNPTVSDSSSRRLSGRRTCRTSGSSVTNKRIRRFRGLLRQQIEQRRLAGVRVADERDERHRRLLPAGARVTPPLPNRVDLFRDRVDSLTNTPAVGLEFRFTGSARADAAAQPRQARFRSRRAAAADT